MSVTSSKVQDDTWTTKKFPWSCSEAMTAADHRAQLLYQKGIFQK